MDPFHSALGANQPSREGRVRLARPDGRFVTFCLDHFVAMAGALALAGYVALYAQPTAELPIHSDGDS